ncbi:MAG TPA: DUF4388 domain-containing protein [Anaeromyxobacteraceae bacterium]|nr:DUF4388 domain-containing protein [Anaeromyxobacteraceae bacterium]
MALTGTLKDFGIAEILQLIGQQAKSGVLHLKNKSEEIHILWADGNVVRAEQAGRKAKERLGGLLVRAGILSEEQLERALEAQQRTLRRLGDVLVELGMVTKDDLREITALQTTETVYKLFHWKSGIYEFEPGAVEWDRETVTPLRAESVLMEGFRQVDEWPMIRRKISSAAMTFLRRKALPPEEERPRGGVTHTLGGAQRLDAGLGDDVDAAFGALEPGHKPTEDDAGALGDAERKVFELAEPGRTVERIIDLSRLGEFESCKALFNLVNLEYLGPVAPSRARRGDQGGYSRTVGQRLRQGVASVVATLAVAAALAGLGYWLSEQGFGPGESTAGRAYRDNGVQRFLSRYQSARLSSALEIYRLERGEYPKELGALVEAGIVAARDLRFPWSQPYHYRRTAEGFVLLPPVE